MATDYARRLLAEECEAANMPINAKALRGPDPSALALPPPIAFGAVTRARAEALTQCWQIARDQEDATGSRQIAGGIARAIGKLIGETGSGD